MQTMKDICIRTDEIKTNKHPGFAYETHMKDFCCSFQPRCYLDYNYLKQTNNNTSSSATPREAIKISLSAASFITITSFQLKQNIRDITSPPLPSLFYLPIIRSIVWGALGLNSMHCDSQNENLVLYVH